MGRTEDRLSLAAGVLAAPNGEALGLARSVPEASAVDADAHAEPGRVNAFEWVAPAALARALVSGDGVVDGVHMSTPPGGAEVYTGPTGAKITDEGFGYNEVGRPSELHEATPDPASGYEASHGRPARRSCSVHVRSVCIPDLAAPSQRAAKPSVRDL